MHEHGPGKRWEGTRYTCSECRETSDRWRGFAQALMDELLSLADVAAAGVFATPRLRSLNDLPLIGEFPPRRPLKHIAPIMAEPYLDPDYWGSLDIALADAERMQRRRRRWFGV